MEHIRESDARGSGGLEFPTESQSLQPGDVAFVPKGQKIAWHGENLKIFIPCVPAWTPAQHELLDG